MWSSLPQTVFNFFIPKCSSDINFSNYVGSNPSTFNECLSYFKLADNYKGNPIFIDFGDTI